MSDFDKVQKCDGCQKVTALNFSGSGKKYSCMDCEYEFSPENFKQKEWTDEYDSTGMPHCDRCGKSIISPDRFEDFRRGDAVQYHEDETGTILCCDCYDDCK